VTLTLRPYQLQALADLRAEISRGVRRILLLAPTGSGKTVISSSIVAGAQERGRSVLFVAHRRELIDQCSRKLDDIGVDHGVMQGDHPRRRPWLPVQVASIQTLIRRELSRPPDIIIIDECHRARAASYQEICAAHPRAIVIGLTATPVRSDGKGLGTLFDAMVKCPPVSEMIAQGYLVPIRAWTHPAPNLKGVAKTAGDYDLGELAARMNRATLIGDLVTTWRKHAAARQTVVFAVNIEHSKAITAQFVAAGVRAEHLDGTTPDRERDGILRRLADGTTRVVSNCAVLTEGWDCPVTSCVVLARPTMSAGLYLQMCLDAETEILTRRGWMNCVDLIEGEDVASFNTKDGGIEWCPARDKFSRHLEDGESFYHVKSPHLDIRVTNQHSIVYKCVSPSNANWHIKTAESISNMGSQKRIPVSGVEFVEPAAISDDEVRFLGWFLTDGTIGKVNNSISISQSSQSPWIAELERVIIACGLKYGKHTVVRKGELAKYPPVVQFAVSKGEPRGRDKHLSGWKHLSRWIDKTLPDVYESLDSRQFSILIEAMNLGNGRKITHGMWTQKTYQISIGDNLVLAEKLQSLAVRRGHRCNLVKYIPKSNTWCANPHELYMLYICKKESAVIGGKSAEPGRSQLVKEEILYPLETAWCVTTRLGTLVTRRNGKVAILGNSGRALRPHPASGKRDCVLLDHGGCIRMHGLVEDDREWALTSDRAVVTTKKPGLAIGTGDTFKVCPDCYAVCSLDAKGCACGYTFSQRRALKLAPERDLVEVKPGSVKIASESQRRFLFERWLDQQANGRTKTGKPFAPRYPEARYRAQFGGWPPRNWRPEWEQQQRRTA
jgi:hypothetical protein